jgi:hypothetical protein
MSKSNPYNIRLIIVPLFFVVGIIGLIFKETPPPKIKEVKEYSFNKIRNSPVTQEPKREQFYAVTDLDVKTLEHMQDTINGENFYYALPDGRGDPKSEFETKADYKARIDKLHSDLSKKGTVGKFSLNDYFVFKGERCGEKDYLCRITFDAENKVWMAKIYPELNVYSKSSTTGAYRGSNAFGVEKIVSQVSRDIVRVHFENLPKETKISFSAAGNKPDLGLVYLAKLKPPFKSSKHSDKAPTLSSPSEEYVSNLTIHSRLAKVLLVNFTTGEVLAGKKF